MGWVQNASPEVAAQSEWRLIVAVCIALSSIMTIGVLLRLYVRAYMIKSLGVDDYVIGFSMVRITTVYLILQANIRIIALRNCICRSVYRADKVGTGPTDCAAATGQS